MCIFEKNIICNNRANTCGGGIYCYGSYAYVTNNLVANNSLHAFRNDMAYFYFQNNTIVNNEGYAIFFVENENNLKSKNDIFWGNLLGTFNYTSFNNFYNAQNSILEDSSGVYPEFVMLSLGSGYTFDGLNVDWSLLDYSPAINAGTPDTSGMNLPLTDLLGNARISGDTIDIGAYEYDMSIFVNLINNNKASIVFPNPTKGYVYFLNKQIIITSVRVIDMKANEVFKQDDGKEIYELDLNSLPKGIYIIEVTTNKGKAVEKLVLE